MHNNGSTTIVYVILHEQTVKNDFVYIFLSQSFSEYVKARREGLGGPDGPLLYNSLQLCSDSETQCNCSSVRKVGALNQSHNRRSTHRVLL